MKNAILFFTEKNGAIDINNAKLFIDDDEYTIRHLTQGGYFSKAELMPYFQYELTTESGQSCIFVSDEVAELILKNNCNLTGKIWNNNSSAHETVAERINSKYGDGVAMNAVKGIDY